MLFPSNHHRTGPFWGRVRFVFNIVTWIFALALLADLFNIVALGLPLFVKTSAEATLHAEKLWFGISSFWGWVVGTLAAKTITDGLMTAIGLVLRLIIISTLYLAPPAIYFQNWNSGIGFAVLVTICVFDILAGVFSLVMRSQTANAKRGLDPYGLNAIYSNLVWTGIIWLIVGCGWLGSYTYLGVGLGCLCSAAGFVVVTRIILANTFEI